MTYKNLSKLIKDRQKPIFVTLFTTYVSFCVGAFAQDANTNHLNHTQPSVQISAQTLQQTSKDNFANQELPSDYELAKRQAKDNPNKPDNFGEYVTKQAQKITRSNASHLNGSDNIQDNPPTYQTQIPFNQAAYTEYNEYYTPLKTFNAGLPQLDTPPNLSTPLAWLEFFSTAIATDNPFLASYALNLNAYSAQEQSLIAPNLAVKLDYLLTQHGLYIFDDLPDRPDGLIEPTVGSQNPLKGVPRRSIKIGTIAYKDRHIPLYIERVKVGDDAPIWVLSGASSENINLLYDQHKPAEFERFFADWLKGKLFGIKVWELIALLLFFALSLGVSWFISRVITTVLTTIKNKSKNTHGSVHTFAKSNFLTDLANKITVPFILTMSFLAVYLQVSGRLPIDPIASSTRPVIWVALVLFTLWLGIRTINFIANRYRDFGIDNLDDEETDKTRRRLTYLSLFRRLFIFVMIIVGFIAGLSMFTDLKGLGTTLLTSAGIAGAIIGIAAQPILGNIMAGVQVAITQPVRIGDTVTLKDEWCTVEDLRYTYAVLMTWDERRLIVPMRHFVTDIICNWSHTDPAQLYPVWLYVDYGADVKAIGEQFIKITKAHKLSDTDNEPTFVVSGVSEHFITLRGVVASSTPNNAWQLSCEVRESMLEYLAQEHAKFLPADKVLLKDNNPFTDPYAPSNHPK
ncbi:mechanosensitive ion channel family protein [Moraxella nasovis]|uniref:mechanosensitive ion channel family protein n=1 Tax=Moraxella nasovis TaxID=2904121 RepID=UPI001F61CBCB|nr:mechanosensitive ion channel family protein [Moraxella nasovis]UNU72501.1 mechanosensitive ion channel family protein [Moraxella nasovis]